MQREPCGSGTQLACLGRTSAADLPASDGRFPPTAAPCTSHLPRCASHALYSGSLEPRSHSLLDVSTRHCTHPTPGWRLQRPLAPAASPEWRSLPPACLLVLDGLDGSTVDRWASAGGWLWRSFRARAVCTSQSDVAFPLCRLRVRLVCTAWAACPPRRLNVHLEDDTLGTGSSSVLLLLTRPGACARLESIAVGQYEGSVGALAVVGATAAHARACGGWRSPRSRTLAASQWTVCCGWPRGRSAS